jgi:hypothetical protein
MKSLILLIAIIILVPVATPSYAMQGQCPNVTVGSADDAVDILRKMTPTTTDIAERKCIEYLLDVVSGEQNAKNIPLLVSFLPFKRVLTVEEEKGFFLHPPSLVSGNPAIGGLARLGVPARTPLVDYIAQSTSMEARHNATIALLLSYHPDNDESPANGIALLKTAARTRSTTAVSNLSESINYALTLSICQRLQKQCQAAAK